MKLRSYQALKRTRNCAISQAASSQLGAALQLLVLFPYLPLSRSAWKGELYVNALSNVWHLCTCKRKAVNPVRYSGQWKGLWGQGLQCHHLPTCNLLT